VGQIVLIDHRLSRLSWISHPTGLPSFFLILRVVVWNRNRCINAILLNSLSDLLLLFIMDWCIFLLSTHRVDLLVNRLLLGHCDALTRG
jgi:hypothetical protein